MAINPGNNSFQLTLSNVDGVESNLKIAVIDLHNGTFVFRCTVLDQDLYDLKLTKDQFYYVHEMFGHFVSLTDSPGLEGEIDQYTIRIGGTSNSNISIHFYFKKSLIFGMFFTPEEFKGLCVIWHQMVKTADNANI